MLASSFSTRFLLRKNRRSRLPAPLGPLFCRPRHGSAAPAPQRQNPGACSHSVAFRSAKPRSWSSAPPGPMFWPAPLSLCSSAVPRPKPRPSSFSIRFFLRKNRRSPPFSDGGALTKSENIILCASSCHPPRSPYPHCTLPRVRFSGIGQKKKPQRKTAAAVNTLYMSCKKTSVNPISFPVALCTKISPFKAIQLLSQCKTKIQFLWMRMRKRSAN